MATVSQGFYLRDFGSLMLTLSELLCTIYFTSLFGQVMDPRQSFLLLVAAMLRVKPCGGKDDPIPMG